MFVFRFYQCFAKCKWQDQPKGRTNTCGERNAVWQLVFARDVLTLFPTGHAFSKSFASVLTSGRANSYSLCFGCLSSSRSLNLTAEEPLGGPIPYVSIR